MQTIRLTLPKLHPAQRSVKDGSKRFNVLDCGRRFGKTTLGIDATIEPLLAGYPVGWFSPTYKYLAEVWREAKNVLQPVTTNKLENEHRLELMTGGVLEMWTLDDPNAGRSRKYKRVVIDEAAKVKKLEEAWGQAIRPTLADYRGDAWFLSTPKGLNYFFHLWGMADRDPKNWGRWKFPTHANPYILPDEIDSMRAELPERVFRQEILAEFIEDGGFFQNIDAAATIAEPDKPEQHAGHYLTAGLDWALSNDFTVLTIACRDCNRVVDWDRFNQIDFTYQRARILDQLRRWNASVLPERNSIGEPNIELLIAAGVPVLSGPDGKPGFQTSATTKPALIQKLAAGLEHDNFRAPADYADELRAYEVETMASGHPKFSAPDGVHDDRVISLALCWWALTDVTSWLLN